MEAIVLLIVMAIWVLVPTKENNKIARLEKKINEHFSSQKNKH